MGRPKYEVPLVNAFEHWMIEGLRFHVEGGSSVRSFAGKHRINPVLFSIWLKDVPELKKINDEYKNYLISKSTFR